MKYPTSSKRFEHSLSLSLKTGESHDQGFVNNTVCVCVYLPEVQSPWEGEGEPGDLGYVRL